MTSTFRNAAALTLFSLCMPVLASCANAGDSRMAGSVPVSKSQAKNVAISKEQDQKSDVETVDAKSEAAAEKPNVAHVTSGPVNYVGQIQTYKARSEDTLLTIGEKYGLGYVEMRSANPVMDPWRPGSGTFMILPTLHLLPDAPRKGIVVNLSEMRLYYYPKSGPIQTMPIGVGREGFSTPMGNTTVTRKVTGPTWRPTDRMRREDPTLPAQVDAGPENPLGSHALYLGWPQYLLHGTNKPWGIGRRVSSGCVRMYNRDAEHLFKVVPVGTSVTVVRQGVKFGWIGDMLYIEAHPDEDLADEVERAGSPQDYKVPEDIFANLSKAAGAKRDQLDWKAVREAMKSRRGYPVPILTGAPSDAYFVTSSMEARAGKSPFGKRLTQEAPLSSIEEQAAAQNEPLATMDENGPVPIPVEPVASRAAGASHPAASAVVPASAPDLPRRRGGFNG